METSVLNLALGGSQHPFRYRPGTSDEGVIVQVLKNSDYNFGRLKRSADLNGVYQRIVRSGRVPLILDAGANIGASAVYFSYSFPESRVLAIEPEQSNFDLLVGNTQGLPVSCLHAAVSSAGGAVQVIDPGHGFWGFRTAAAADGLVSQNAVPCVTIGDLYEQQSDTAEPFIAKIDIEGAENDLFSVNTGWVSRTPILIIELHDWMLPGQANSRGFLKCIADLDRDFVHIGENIFSIDNKLCAPENAVARTAA
jgi:FkbM family methyltransferase